MLGPLAFRWFNQKYVVHQNILHGGTLLISVSTFEFAIFVVVESISFHCEMFHMTNFGLVLCIGIVYAMISINKKYIDKLVQDQFLQIVRDLRYKKNTDKLVQDQFFTTC